MIKGLFFPITLLFLSLLSFCGSVQGQTIPLAEKGVLDIRHLDLETTGVIKLKGEWAFYWNRLLTPKDFKENKVPQSIEYIDIPSVWNNKIVDGSRLSGSGYATFHLKVRVKPKQGVLALKTLDESSAFKIWINELPPVSSGVVGRTSKTSTPGYQSQIIFIPDCKDSIDIFIQISNFSHRKGGFWNTPSLGRSDDILWDNNRVIMMEYLLFGGILVMGLYHLALFSMRKKDRSALYFGIFCLVVALRIGLIGERSLHMFLSDVDWDWLFKFEVLTFYSAVPLFLLFLSHFFSEINKMFIQLVLSISIVFSLFVLVSDSITGSKSIVPFQIVVLVLAPLLFFYIMKAVVRKKEGSIAILIGTGVLVGTMIHDILKTNMAFRGFELASFGLLFFIMIQSYMLAVRFSNAFKEVEVLSKDLELKVAERTEGFVKANEALHMSMEQLEETQAQLIQAQKMEAVGILAGGIAHDFNTMIGTILGYTNIIAKDIPKDSIIQDDLKSIATVSRQAKQLVRQIQDFSKPKSDAKEKVNFVDLVKKSLDFVKNLLPKNIKIIQDYRFDELCVDVNENQIQQVIVNLSSNAADFMLGDDQQLTIQVDRVDSKEEMSQFPDIEPGNYVKLTLSDNGVGIEKGNLDKVFNPFFTTRDIGEGTGLGLSIVHNIVHNHSGYIFVDSEVNRGTVFRLYFPEIKNPEIEPEDNMQS